ncbi:MAG TPA: hypothetical protein VGO93_26730 [Candidatus Xenobia bacterium]|jgi:hypothetical protein
MRMLILCCLVVLLSCPAPAAEKQICCLTTPSQPVANKVVASLVFYGCAPQLLKNDDGGYQVWVLEAQASQAGVITQSVMDTLQPDDAGVRAAGGGCGGL